ncbi:hypothetical protein GGR56DRAFT_462984 [Xylariaceae sp. FL0804]|nr:hypothetical protein GGR56DRAFT_462984 [Xylariaceae sp. FL0804]
MRGSELITGLLGGAAAVLAATVPIAATEETAAPMTKTPPPPPRIWELPPLREQADLVDGWTEARKALIPGLLRKYGVDAWLVTQREYAEDTVFWALKEATQFSARRRTTHLYLLTNASSSSSSSSGQHGNDDDEDDDDASSSSSSPGSSGGYEHHAWVDNTARVWAELRDVLAAAQPATVALNTHAEIAFAAGLHAGELETVRAELLHHQQGHHSISSGDDDDDDDDDGTAWRGEFVLEPMLAVEVVATMVPARLAWYRRMMETAWAIIGEAFSEAVVRPGESTSWDVEWWMRDKIQSLNYSTWFQPGVYILNKGEPFTAFDDNNGSDPRAPDLRIDYGDIIHCDFGVTALGLNTDTQHIGYVLGPGETAADVPRGVLDGLAKVNRLQDIVVGSMVVGRTGNAILAAARAQMAAEGIEGKIYCHPTGEWGHSAGTVIGMTNLQDGVPVIGDLPLLKNTYYSIELYAEHFVPEMNKTIFFPQEEDVYWDDEAGTWEWVYGRQEELLLVRSPATAGPGFGAGEL